jgi:hypothetical protein
LRRRRVEPGTAYPELARSDIASVFDGGLIAIDD